MNRDYENDPDELRFETGTEYPDSVPVFDRGKERDLSTDHTVPDYTKGKDSTLRTCPVCTKVFSLRDVEIGYIDEFGEPDFFCSQEHKDGYRKLPIVKQENRLYGKGKGNRTSTRPTDIKF